MIEEQMRRELAGAGYPYAYTESLDEIRRVYNETSRRAAAQHRGLQGKGVFIWQIQRCEGGDPEAIAAKAQAAQLTHVLIKIADTRYAFGFDRNGRDLVPPVVQALKNRGIQVWGWHYVKGNDPTGEANVAVARTSQMNLDGYVVDAEHEYKYRGKDAAARHFMDALRRGLPNTRIALSSYRFPRYHRELPWAEFLEKCDYNMPQVYWEKANNPGNQLERSVQEFSDTGMVGHSRPVVPTGSAYGAGGWVATADDQSRFFQKALDLGLSAASSYSWDWATSPGNHHLWDAIASFDWPLSEPDPQPPPEPDPTPIELGTIAPPIEPDDPVTIYMDALNRGDVESIMALYHPNAGHVSSSQMIFGTQAIREWYERLVDDLLPQASFKTTDVRGQQSSWTFAWSCASSAGKVIDGRDTLGMRGGRIQYHYTRFAIT